MKYDMMEFIHNSSQEFILKLIKNFTKNERYAWSASRVLPIL